MKEKDTSFGCLIMVSVALIIGMSSVPASAIFLIAFAIYKMYNPD